MTTVFHSLLLWAKEYRESYKQNLKKTAGPRLRFDLEQRINDFVWDSIGKTKNDYTISLPESGPDHILLYVHPPKNTPSFPQKITYDQSFGGILCHDCPSKEIEIEIKQGLEKEVYFNDFIANLGRMPKVKKSGSLLPSFLNPEEQKIFKQLDNQNPTVILRSHELYAKFDVSFKSLPKTESKRVTENNTAKLELRQDCLSSLGFKENPAVTRENLWIKTFEYPGVAEHFYTEFYGYSLDKITEWVRGKVKLPPEVTTNHITSLLKKYVNRYILTGVLEQTSLEIEKKEKEKPDVDTKKESNPYLKIGHSSNKYGFWCSNGFRIDHPGNKHSAVYIGCNTYS